MGTESAIDKSKGVKSFVMDLFPKNPSMEGKVIIIKFPKYIIKPSITIK